MSKQQHFVFCVSVFVAFTLFSLSFSILAIFAFSKLGWFRFRNSARQTDVIPRSFEYPHSCCRDISEISDYSLVGERANTLASCAMIAVSIAFGLLAATGPVIFFSSLVACISWQSAIMMYLLRSGLFRRWRFSETEAYFSFIGFPVVRLNPIDNSFLQICARKQSGSDFYVGFSTLPARVLQLRADRTTAEIVAAQWSGMGGQVQWFD